jgi:hypothetical protein
MEQLLKKAVKNICIRITSTFPNQARTIIWRDANEITYVNSNIIHDTQSNSYVIYIRKKEPYINDEQHLVIIIDAYGRCEYVIK